MFCLCGWPTLRLFQPSKVWGKGRAMVHLNQYNSVPTQGWVFSQNVIKERGLQGLLWLGQGHLVHRGWAVGLSAALGTYETVPRAFSCSQVAFFTSNKVCMEAVPEKMRWSKMSRTIKLHLSPCQRWARFLVRWKPLKGTGLAHDTEYQSPCIELPLGIWKPPHVPFALLPLWILEWVSRSLQSCQVRLLREALRSWHWAAGCTDKAYFWTALRGNLISPFPVQFPSHQGVANGLSATLCFKIAVSYVYSHKSLNVV